MKKIEKVVIPVAGNGTRFLPITKTISKTLLPLIDKPVIQYLLEEAISAGMKEAIIIIGSNQKDVVDYFDTDSLYVKKLNKTFPEIEYIKEMKKKINIIFIEQDEPKGLAHAVYQAKKFIDGSDFALILGDDLVLNNDEGRYGIGSLCECYAKNPSYYLGVQEVDYNDTSKYGIIEYVSLPNFQNIMKVNSIIEKPQINPPSNLACVGRYILKNNIFDAIEQISVGVGGEFQLTDALNVVLSNEIIYASTFKGIRYDVGSKKEYALAVDAIAKQRGYS